MIDSVEQQTRANKIFMVLKDFERYFPDEFYKCDIHRCGHCDGTGLGNKHSMSQCTNCGGMGYVGYEKIGKEFVCRTCNGYGCEKCDMRGFVDWVVHANGRDIKKYKKPYDYRPPEST